MKVTIELPDVIAAELSQKWDDIPRRILESVAMDGYRRGDLTSLQVGEMLGLRTRAEIVRALERAGIDIESAPYHLHTQEEQDEDPAELLRRSQERIQKAGERVQKAVHRMQEKGILDAEGRLIDNGELPADMRPDPRATFKH